MSEERDQIVRMANDIANFYHTDPDREHAISGMVSHISRFWARRMREKLIQHAKDSDSGLSELSLAAAARLAALRAAKKPAGPKSPAVA
ncbi:MAG: formate dehydrogenase subunit delta [Steroidobacterales bacterium]